MVVPGKNCGRDPLSLACRAAALVLAVLWLVTGSSFASAEPEFGHVVIPRLSSPPKLDDFLSMGPSDLWRGKMARISGFTQRIPSDGQPSTQRTDVYLGYNEKNLYAIFVCFDTDPGKLRARLSRREDIFDDDSVEIMLDTFNDHRRAYAFLANP